jgi:hypothetical protein
MPNRFVVVAALVLATADIGAAQACTAPKPDDLDCDGISDRVESTLLARFRPFLRFSKDGGSGETFRPTDVVRYLRSAEIDGTGTESEKVLITTQALNLNLLGLLNLDVNDHDRYCNQAGAGQWTCASNVLRNTRRTDYGVNPDNEIGRRGAEWAQVLASKKIGLYGHVVPLRLTSAEAFDRSSVPSGADANGHLYYKIEYWQFFGYSSNDKPFDQGDHEGDWDTVQLIYDPGNQAAGGAPGRLMSVLYYAHGKEMRFDMSSVTGSVDMDQGTVREWRGSNYNNPVPNLSDDGADAKARNHVLRMFKDPVSGEFSHPVVFVEHGGHEFWPSPFWEITAAQKHGGDDLEHSYLTSPPPNLGEVEHPLSEDPAAKMILQFNGRWGTYSRHLAGIFQNAPPPGPPLHFEWTWPASSAIRWQLKGIEY